MNERAPSLQKDLYLNTELSVDRIYKFHQLMDSVGYQINERDLLLKSKKLNFYKTVSDEQFPRFHIIFDFNSGLKMDLHEDIRNHKTLFLGSNISERRHNELNRLIKSLENLNDANLRNQMLNCINDQMFFGLSRMVKKWEKNHHRNILHREIQDLKRDENRGKKSKIRVMRKTDRKLQELIFAA